ncbi:MAG: hypothetical protein R3C12_03345 [Planctomycetaceae bacterium]|nr:hypothetical protein [Planctomycetaceae bacterium]
MNARFLPGLLLVAGCYFGALPAQPVRAQVLNVQQPIVEQFGVASTVLVPDRGRSHLGSLSTGRDFDARFGPFPAGRVRLREQTHSSLSASVFIHDLAEMDSLLLNRPNSAPPFPFEESEAESRKRTAAGMTAPLNPRDRNVRRSTLPVAATAPQAQPLLQAGPVADRIASEYLRKAEQALQAGNVSLARIYFQLAEKNGSPRQTDASAEQSTSRRPFR